MIPTDAVSVIIPTFNGEQWLDETLLAVQSQLTDVEIEIICIDSGSTDRTVAICRDRGARLLTIEPGTFNHGRTRNVAIEASGGDIVCLLTQDALPANDRWLSSLVSAFDDPRVAGAYSRQAPRPDASPLTRYLVESCLAGRGERVDQRIDDFETYRSLPPYDRIRLVCFDNVSSAMRRSVWREFPFATVPFGEDLDWSRQVIEAGYTVVFEPESLVIHSHDRSHAYEFKRAYAFSRLLAERFGMRLIERLRQVLPCTRRMWREYRGVLAASPGKTSRRELLDAQLRGLATCVAQYTGGNAAAWLGQLPILGPLDALIRRNV